MKPTTLGNTEIVNYKRYLKSLLQSNVLNLLFTRPLSRRKSENVYTDSVGKKLVDEHSNKADDHAAIFEVAKVIRNDLTKHRQWNFNGSFSDFEVPKSLSMFLEWLLVGPKPLFKDDLKRRKQLPTT